MVDYQALKSMGKTGCNAINNSLFFGYDVVEGTFFTPTTIRRQSSVRFQNNYRFAGNIVGISIGISSMITNIMWTFHGLTQGYDSDNLEVKQFLSAIQLSTVLASGLYEWYRYETKKITSTNPSVAINPITTSKKSGSLDDKVNEPVKPVVKPVVPDVDASAKYFDPWSINFPKVQDKKRNE